MPSSSATCSTTTVSTIASRSVRVSQRCSIGRRNSTSRVGVAPVPRTSDDSGTVSESQSSGICGASSTAYSTRPSRSCQRSSMSVTMPRARSSKRSRGGPQLGRARARGAARPGPRIPRPRRSRSRGVAAAGRRAGVVHAASLIGRGAVRRVPSAAVSPARRCSRTACGRPAVTTLTYVYADQTAVLGPLATYAEPHAYDLCERPQRAAVGPARLGGAAARARPGRPGPVQRRPARPRRRRPRGRPPGAAARAGPTPAEETGREVDAGAATCACSPPTDPRRGAR